MAPICTLNNADETENVGADECELSIPKALLFNDSLDEGVDPTALLEDADLPTECAAAEPKPASDVSREVLNDSLDAEDLDDTQLPGTGSEELTQATAERKTTASIEPKAVTPQADSNKEEGIELSPQVSSASLEKKVEASSERNEMPPTESQASKGAKVKPSFGKKKKGFNPPMLVNKAATTTARKSENDKQPEKVSDQSKCSASDKIPPQNTHHETIADSTEKQFVSDPGSDGKTTTKEKKMKLPDKKMAEEKKMKEKEKKEQERAQKKQALEEKKLEREKKKAELERQRNEKRLELERKKAEREQKKMEKELKKMEREQKKMEKQAKASHKKQKTKDKKTEGTSSSSNGTSVEKDEVEPTLGKDMEDVKFDKRDQEEFNINAVGEEPNQTDVTVLPTDGSSEPDQEDKENVPPKETESSEISTTHIAAAFSRIASCDENTKKQMAKVKTFSPPKKAGDQQTTTIKEKETTSLNEPQKSDVSEDKNQSKDSTVLPSAGASKSTKTSGAGTEKQEEKKVKKFHPPKAKKAADLLSSKEVKKPRKEGTKARKAEKCLGEVKTQTNSGMKRKALVHSDNEDDLEAKRSKPENHLSSVWVQCENANCKKWRLLKDCDDPAKVPGKWVCSMNTDPDHNSCSAEEEQWSDLGDSQEFVESPYIAGSIVWSKMDGYPW